MFVTKWFPYRCYFRHSVSMECSDRKYQCPKYRPKKTQKKNSILNKANHLLLLEIQDKCVVISKKFCAKSKTKKGSE